MHNINNDDVPANFGWSNNFQLSNIISEHIKFVSCQIRLKITYFMVIVMKFFNYNYYGYDAIKPNTKDRRLYRLVSDICLLDCALIVHVPIQHQNI